MKIFGDVHDTPSILMLIAFVASIPAAVAIYFIWPDQWTRGIGLIILTGGMYLFKRYEHREKSKHQ